jgi:hypothetical protein
MSAPTFSQPDRTYRIGPAVRRALLVIAGVLGLAMVASTSFMLLDLAARHTSTQRATFDGVRALVVEDASDVRITSAPAGAPVTVLARVTEGLRGPRRSAARLGDGTLRLSASCPGFFGGQCGVDYEIRVPSGTLVRAESNGGDVVAEDLEATQPVALHSSAGDVTALNVTAPSITLSSSAGDVGGGGLSARRIKAESSAGDVTLALRTPATSVLADSSAGDVDVLLPDAVYRVDATSSAGDVDSSSVRTDPDSPRAVTAHSSAGDVHVAARR